MQVLWQLTSSQTCTIGWGTDPNRADGSAQVDDYGSDYQYSHTITGLASGTKHYYYVYADDAYQLGSFITAPDASATDVKFMAYGDTRTTPSSHNKVVGQVINTYTLDPDFQTLMIHVGDWVNANTEDSWTGQYFPTDQANLLQFKKEVPINGCRGNHEGSGTIYNKYWPYPYVSSFYWSFDYGPAHFTIVDQYVDYAAGSNQYTWIVNDLASSTKQWKFIVFHEPGWTDGGAPNDPIIQNDIQPLCLQYGVDVIFAGHNHYYARCEVDGVQHITTGGGGAPLSTPEGTGDYLVVSERTYQHCEITITGDQLDFVSRRSDDGSVVDTFTITHTADADQPTPISTNPSLN